MLLQIRGDSPLLVDHHSSKRLTLEWVSGLMLARFAPAQRRQNTISWAFHAGPYPIILYEFELGG
jgi:hypothetical protein